MTFTASYEWYGSRTSCGVDTQPRPNDPLNIANNPATDEADTPVPRALSELPTLNDQEVIRRQRPRHSGQIGEQLLRR